MSFDLKLHGVAKTPHDSTGMSLLSRRCLIPHLTLQFLGSQHARDVVGLDCNDFWVLVSVVVGEKDRVCLIRIDLLPKDYY